MNDVDTFAQILWDYHKLNQTIEKSDLIFALGSHDIRVARRAAELYLEGYAPLILFSGNEGVGKEISGFNGIPEAESFKKEAVKLGVPADKILTETAATNTGENISFSKALLENKEIKHKTIIAVQKPYMERRTFATLMAQWGEPLPRFIVTSQQISYENCVSNPLYPKDYNISLMVGDLQRIIEYPKLGWQIPQ